MSYTDIHFHLLPGVDDGPKTIEESIELAATAFAEGTRTIVATPFSGLGEDFSSATDELRDRGFGVVVAHPERAPDSDGSRWRALRYELAHGSVLQVNAWSLDGRHGMEAQAVARRLVREGRAQVVAYDAHGGRRQPALLLGRDAAAFAELSRRDADCLIRSNPRRLLERGLGVPRRVGVA
jgi:protein-tyrosine phosphatase